MFLELLFNFFCHLEIANSSKKIRKSERRKVDPFSVFCEKQLIIVNNDKYEDISCKFLFLLRSAKYYLAMTIFTIDLERLLPITFTEISQSIQEGAMQSLAETGLRFKIVVR